MSQNIVMSILPIVNIDTQNMEDAAPYIIPLGQPSQEEEVAAIENIAIPFKDYLNKNWCCEEASETLRNVFRLQMCLYRRRFRSTY